FNETPYYYEERGKIINMWGLISAGIFFFLGYIGAFDGPPSGEIYWTLHTDFTPDYYTVYNTKIQLKGNPQSFDYKKVEKGKLSPTHFKEYDSGILQVLRNGLSKWKILKELIAKYEQKLNYNEIDNWEYQELYRLGAPKGEFETTLQYNDRLKKEELTRRSIEAEYQQKRALKKDKYERARTKLYRNIENITAEIKFERSYEFSMSKYDADRQKYSFMIPSLRERKELVVPIDEA
ncbi:uncharacterized protein METZ01_LOCUS496359, partial [marine metagenome]